MKKILAVAMLLIFGCFKVHAQEATPTVVPVDKGTAIVAITDHMVWTKALKDAIHKAQDLKNNGQYQDAVDAAPLAIQKAWYALDVLRKLMGGELTEGHWGAYHFDSGTLQFLGDKKACLEQADVVLLYCGKVTEPVYSKEVETIKFYVGEYQDWINNGLPKKTTSDDSTSGND